MVLDEVDQVFVDFDVDDDDDDVDEEVDDEEDEEEVEEEVDDEEVDDEVDDDEDVVLDMEEIDGCRLPVYVAKNEVKNPITASLDDRVEGVGTASDLELEVVDDVEVAELLDLVLVDAYMEDDEDVTDCVRVLEESAAVSLCPSSFLSSSLSTTPSTIAAAITKNAAAPTIVQNQRLRRYHRTGFCSAG